MKRNLGFFAVGILLIIVAYNFGQGNGSVSRMNIDNAQFSFNDKETNVNFTTTAPGFCQVLIGTKSGVYDQVALESMPNGPHQEHVTTVTGLKPNTEYRYKINFTTADGTISQSKEATFTTPANMAAAKDVTQASNPEGTNVASLANGGRILGVSSNYSNAANNEMWGAEKAIDGDLSSEWSTAGDGNNAWIEIGFNQPYNVTSIGLWTRTMGTSAEINKFKVTTKDGKELGTYSLNGATEMQYFNIETPVKTDALRFEVVESSGGNTGAVEIEVYAK